MSTTTTNLHLIKPDVNDAVDVSNLNDNMDIIDAAIAQYTNGLYPVGSIYMSVNAVDPSTLFGGTWSRIKDTFLLAAGDAYTANSTGGQVSHTHTTADHALTLNEMPRHRHEGLYWTGANTSAVECKSDDGSTCRKVTSVNGAGGNSSHFYTGYAGVDGASHNHGDTGSASNMPPYLAVYVWVRTA